MSQDIFSQNYFEIFDLPVAFELDLARLNENNRALQKQYHPDRVTTQDEAESRRAMQLTSLINQAFDTLKSPIARAQYLLKLKGVDMESDTDTSMDGAFLMEQMEFREAIAEVRDQDDPLDVLDRMAKDLKQTMKQLEQQFSTSYAEDSLEQARDAVRKMQFIIKAQQEVKDISEQLEDELF